MPENLILEQAKVDELVEKFYERLLKEPSFVTMFRERQVDVNRLIERQKHFIFELINNTNPDANSKHSNQVKERHAFQANPERAKLWLDTMFATIDDLDIDNGVKQTLKEKISQLMSYVGH
ncbi:protoglobin domain-containing protein [Tuberibacillus calidus]|uniref:protoglobin domain-containing protein n=1 Tax=Tuberibacillus calidus TaxID=340097 RepID=UPI00041F67FD|nr:protoglobin domain-containing protein [Tuberibacillus calidus]